MNDTEEMNKGREQLIPGEMRSSQANLRKDGQ